MIKYTDYLKRAGGLNPVHKATNYTANTNECVFVDTTGGVIKITTPASPSLDGARFRVVDAFRKFNTNKCTIVYDGSKTINGGTSNIDVSTQGAVVELIYDSAQNNWTLVISAASSGSSGGAGVGDYFLMPNQFVFDGDTFGADTGVAFGILETIDFRPDITGKIIANFPFPIGWSPSKDILIRMYYNLNGNDNGKVVRMVSDIWVINSGATPNPASPTIAGTIEDITSAAGNTNVEAEYVFTTIKVPLAQLSINTKTIVLALSRAGDSVNDTYGGTLQLIKMIAYQAA
jgi:hypothetical protein